MTLLRISSVSAPGTCRARLPALLALALASGCSTLPSSGPTASDILAAREADTLLAASLIDLAPNLLEEANATAPTVALSSLAAAGEVDRIGPGDELQISIFEVGTTLFSSVISQMGLPVAAGSPLPPVTVAHDGTISLPYVGRLAVAGRRPAEIEDMIEAGLQGLSERAEASVSVRQNRANSIFVLGSVRTPGRIPLSLSREHLLDAIALAGGPLHPPQSTTVRVTRRGHSAEIGLDQLRAGSADDLVLLPGDRIEVLPVVRSFTVFGAAGKVSEFPIDMPQLTLAQALARAGGPADHQADPTAVFVFRWGQPAAPDADPRPVIYRLNMMDPASYFTVQRFVVREGDVLYVANARTNQASKLVQIINQLFSPVFTVRQMTRD